MAEPLVCSESPVEYFRELVESALHRQRLVASRFTAFYLVNLLAGFVQLDQAAGDAETEALGVRFARALQEPGARQRDELRRVGDRSLFISGFFADSLNRSLVDIDYYMQIGERAYAVLASRDESTFSDVFDELAAKFPAFVDVLGEVSERTALASNADLLRLYEKWLRTRSPRSGDRLAALGIAPNASLGTRFVQ